jgi:hypothetical protein
MWGPDSAALVAVLRMDRIAASPYRDAVQSVVSSIPEWKAMVGTGAAIDPFKDVSALLLATTDPNPPWDPRKTFLVAAHTVPPERVVRALSASFDGGVSWEQDAAGRLYGTPNRPLWRQDPRRILVPVDGLFVLTDPVYIAPMLDGAPPAGRLRGTLDRVRAIEGSGEGSGAVRPGRRAPAPGLPRAPVRPARPVQPRAVTPSEGSGSAVPAIRAPQLGPLPTLQPPRVRPPPERLIANPAGRPTPLSPVSADEAPPLRADGWIKGLLEIADFGGVGEAGPAADLTVRGISSMRLPGMVESVPPQVIHAAVTLGDNPVIAGRMLFESRDKAAVFVREWPRMAAAIKQQLGLFGGLAAPLIDATWRVEDTEAIFTIVVPKPLMDQIVVSIAALRGSR